MRTHVKAASVKLRLGLFSGSDLAAAACPQKSGAGGPSMGFMEGGKSNQIPLESFEDGEGTTGSPRF